jgi:ankyrin repeat protein
LLADKGVNIELKDDDGCTALHIAAWEDSLATARLLIERGADVNAVDDDADTPLHMAAWKNSIKVAKLLIEHGADLNAKDESGRTPLDRASVANYPYAQALCTSRRSCSATQKIEEVSAILFTCTLNLWRIHK